MKEASNIWSNNPNLFIKKYLSCFLIFLCKRIKKRWLLFNLQSREEFLSSIINYFYHTTVHCKILSFLYKLSFEGMFNFHLECKYLVANEYT